MLNSLHGTGSLISRSLGGQEIASLWYSSSSVVVTTALQETQATYFHLIPLIVSSDLRLVSQGEGGSVFVRHTPLLPSRKDGASFNVTYLLNTRSNKLRQILTSHLKNVLC
jgi:hypothetical protein